jgi:tRNA A-37 threonylcarbamoyl transferase component Bud32/CheY-like chemotaxis protein
MAEVDAESFAEQAILIGLTTREQMREAREDAEDGSLESLSRVLVRKGYLTSWQKDRLLKGDPTGFFFGGCKVMFHIAEGTFARVYRGARIPGESPVAIKVLRRRFTTDSQAVQRFMHEAEAGLKLVHPNIVRILDYGEQDKNYFIIMEYVEGSNLRDFLKLRTRLAVKDALPLMLGLARGLQHALDQGISHRDIKATNILISTKGHAKLVDFGLAELGDEHRMEIAHGQRTVDYSALERSCGSPKGDFRSDIYFLGSVYYQMLTGNAPMPETESSDQLTKMLKRSFAAIKPINEHRYAPPPGLAQIIGGMMKVDVRSRYQIMKDVVEDLEAFEKAFTGGDASGTQFLGRFSVNERVTDEDLEFFREAFSVPTAPVANVPNVLCVEVQDSIQEAFRKCLTQMGYRVLLVSDAERAAERYRESPPDAVIYDVDGLGPEAFDAFLDMQEKAHDDGHELAAIVLLGPKQRSLREQLPANERLIVLQKPIKMKDVQDAIGQLLPLEPQSAARRA